MDGWLSRNYVNTGLKFRILPIEKSPTFRRRWFTVSAGWLKMEPAGKAEAGSAGVQPTEE
jgi:hypothetical protein